MNDLAMDSPLFIPGHSNKGGIKRLKPKHLRIISLHLQGESSEVIAISMGVSPNTVYRVLREPKARELIAGAMSHYQDELQALAPKVVSVIRSNLENGDPQMELKASDMWLKTQGLYKTGKEDPHTGEDVVQELLRIRASASGEGAEVEVTIGKARLSNLADNSSVEISND